MALGSTLYRFRVELADIDRSVYETLDLRVPCHPSETAERLVVRVLARAITHEEELEFGKGLSTTEEPALWNRSAQGQVRTWIDVGKPSAPRLHRANKQATRVVVITTKSENVLRKEWSGQTIYEAHTIELIHLPESLVTGLAENLARTQTWFVTIQDDNLSVADEAGTVVDGTLRRQALSSFLDSQ
jgi:uncharacterized protein YaeQ